MGIANRTIRQKEDCMGFFLNVNLFKSTVIGRFNSFMAYNIHSCGCLNIKSLALVFWNFHRVCVVFKRKDDTNTFSAYKEGDCNK